jgi:D-alanine-D-alanine ligase
VRNQTELMQKEPTIGAPAPPPATQPAEHVADLEAQVERLMPRLRLAVIFGGDKSNPGSVIYPSRNTRSWKSYEAVATDIAHSLRRIGFRHVHLMPDDMHLGERLRREDIHMAWLNTGGIQGYNPTAHAPAMLEMLGVPYVGHDSLSATTLDNKHVFKREAHFAGLPTAAFVTWHMARGPFRPELNSQFQRAFGDYPGPFVVKPVSGRASLHVHVIDDRSALAGAIDDVYRATENLVLVEKYLAGRELCIAVAGPVTAHARRLVRRHEPFAFAALERVLTADERIFTSMDVRPITAERYRFLDPDTDATLLAQARDIANQVFLEFNLGSLVRIDLRADETGRLFILEANPKPDLKIPVEGVTSLIVAGLRDAGMDYDDLILSLLADRLDFLLRHRRDNVQHIVELLLDARLARHRSSLDPLRAKPQAASEAYRHSAGAADAAEDSRAAVNLLVASVGGADRDTIGRITETATDASLEALNAVRRPAAPPKQRKFGS